MFAARLPREDDEELPSFDNTKLVAINTCPTWGLVRYEHHKTPYKSEMKPTPLTMGSAAHDVFAAVRFWDMWKHNEQASKLDIEAIGHRIFGEERFSNAFNNLESISGEREQLTEACMRLLDSSEFVEDPNDRRRTMVNLEIAMINYIHRWSFGTKPVWIRDPNNPLSDVGIETPFDLVIQKGQEKAIRFVGRIDGIHYGSPSRDQIILHENKTMSAITEGWMESVHTMSQITGYCVATSVLLTETVKNAIVYGTSVPLPANSPYGGFVALSTHRTASQLSSWFEWVFHTVDIWERYKDTPTSAPMYTHSCTRYNRACSLIQFCAMDQEDRDAYFAEMFEDRWSPLGDD